MSIPEMSGTYAALANRDFRFFISLRILMTLTMMMMSLSVSWQVYDLTNDPLALGLVGLTEAIPSILISLWAGHIADKINRRTILIGCGILMLACIGLLLFATINMDSLGTRIGIGIIYFSVFLSGICRGFYGPAYTAFLPQLVDKKILSNAITWNSSAWEIASVLGLSLGGLFYGFIGAKNTYWVMAALLVLALWVIRKIPKRPDPVFVVGESALVRIIEGLRFVWNKPLLINALSIDMLAVLLGGAVALLPVFAKDVLHIGPEGLGMLRASVGIGAILTSVIIAHKRPGKNAGKHMLLCIAGFGLCIIGFGLSTSFYMAFFFLFLSGMLDALSVFIRSSLVQHLTPDHMKGRVTSINKIFITSSNEIGAFESGLTAKWMGTIPAILFGGAACIAIVAGFALWAPSLRNLNFTQLEDESVA
jgi:MFS family permease